MCVCVRECVSSCPSRGTLLCSECCSLGWNRLRDVVAEQARVAEPGAEAPRAGCVLLSPSLPCGTGSRITNPYSRCWQCLLG